MHLAQDKEQGIAQHQTNDTHGNTNLHHLLLFNPLSEQ